MVAEIAGTLRATASTLLSANELCRLASPNVAAQSERTASGTSLDVETVINAMSKFWLQESVVLSFSDSGTSRSNCSFALANFVSRPEGITPNAERLWGHVLENISIAFFSQSDCQLDPQTAADCESLGCIYDLLLQMFLLGFDAFSSRRHFSVLIKWCDAARAMLDHLCPEPMGLLLVWSGLLVSAATTVDNATSRLQLLEKAIQYMEVVLPSISSDTCSPAFRLLVARTWFHRALCRDEDRVFSGAIRQTLDWLDSSAIPEKPIADRMSIMRFNARVHGEHFCFSNKLTDASLSNIRDLAVVLLQDIPEGLFLAHCTVGRVWFESVCRCENDLSNDCVTEGLAHFDMALRFQAPSDDLLDYAVTCPDFTPFLSPFFGLLRIAAFLGIRAFSITEDVLLHLERLLHSRNLTVLEFERLSEFIRKNTVWTAESLVADVDNVQYDLLSLSSSFLTISVCFHDDIHPEKAESRAIVAGCPDPMVVIALNADSVLSTLLAEVRWFCDKAQSQMPSPNDLIAFIMEGRRHQARHASDHPSSMLFVAKSVIAFFLYCSG